VISTEAPLAAALFGKKGGTELHFEKEAVPSYRTPRKRH
jgi:transcription elongation GreA/GreB family factor